MSRKRSGQLGPVAFLMLTTLGVAAGLALAISDYVHKAGRGVRRVFRAITRVWPIQ